MTKHTATEVYNAARQAGLSSASAVLATAVALGESVNTGLDDTARGDLALQNNTWGPSIGVWQIRTQKQQTGTGQDRDISALSGNLARQAAAMKNISSGGTNFTAWTVYNTGAYQKYTGQASAAAVGGTSALPVRNPLDPFGLLPKPSDVTGAIGDQLQAAVEPARNLALKLLFGVLGLTLAGAGVAMAVGGYSARELKREAGNGVKLAGVVK